MSANQIGRTVLLLAAAAYLPAAAQNYTVTTFSVPDSRSHATYGMGINDSGDVVGFGHFFVDFFAYYVGYLRHADGTFQYPILDPNSEYGGNVTLPTGIDDSGLIAGYYNNGAEYLGFLLSNGNFSTVNEGSNTEIDTIDNNGDFGGVIGFLGFVSIGGTVTQFSVPGADTTTVSGLSPDGVTVGTALLHKNDEYVGFVRGANGGFHLFTVRKAFRHGTFATGINEHLQLIVGYYLDSGEIAHGFVYHYTHPLDSVDDPSPGAVQILDGPDTVSFDAAASQASTYVQGVNSSGVLVGTYQPYNGTGRLFGFIATPIPR